MNRMLLLNVRRYASRTKRPVLLPFFDAETAAMIEMGTNTSRSCSTTVTRQTSAAIHIQHRPLGWQYYTISRNAGQIFTSNRKRGARVSHPSISKRSYSSRALLIEYTKRIKNAQPLEKSWEEVESIIDEMEAERIKSDVVFHGALIDACARYEKGHEAVNLLNVMNDAGIPPNDICCNAAISACEKSGMWKTAINVLRTMESLHIQPDVKSYSATISACEKGGQWEKAVALLKEMGEKHGIRPNEYSYSAAISACEKGDQWEKAMELLEEMQVDDIKSNDICYHAAITACGKGGQWEKAIELFEEMQNKHHIVPDLISYRTIIKACFDCSKFPQASIMLQQAQKRNVLPTFLRQKSNKWDLHDMTISVSCMLLSDALLKLTLAGNRNKPQHNDIIVVTGQGHGSGVDGPVLQKEVPDFLKKQGGPAITPMKNNPGCFMITKVSLEKWMKSKDFERFKKILSDHVLL